MTTRRMVALAVAMIAAIAAAGCAPPSFHPAWPDTQVELRDDTDREQAIDRLWVLPPGPERDRARTPIAAAIAVRIAELDGGLGFADELARADSGPLAARAQPIALLEPTALALPLRWLVDRYVALQIERQHAVAALIDQQGASMALVRSHRDFLATARRIANVLARAGRASEIHRYLAQLGDGGGSDRELGIRAEVVADQPTADAY